MRQILMKSIIICVIYGISSFFFSFVSKFLFKIYHFNSFFLLILVETIIDLILSSSIIYAKEIISFKYSNLDQIKKDFSEFLKERIIQFKETFFLSFFFLFNNVFGVKGLSQVSIPIFLALKRTLIFYVLMVNYFMGSAKSINSKMVLAIVFITLGALLMGYNDLEGNLIGYLNMTIHNTLTAITLELSKTLNTKKSMSPMNIVFNTAFNCLPMAFFMFYISDDYELLYDYNSTYQNAFYLCLGIVLIAAFFHHYLTFLCATANSPLAIALTHNIKDLFSTTAGILYFNDLKLDIVVFFGLIISFSGAFLFSYIKVSEIYEIKGKEKKDDEDKKSVSKEKDSFIIYVIEPQIK